MSSPMQNLNNIVLGLESGGNRYDKNGQILTSPAGAKGEMQVMDATNSDPGFGVVPARDNSPEERARVGRDYLSAMQQRYNDPAKALAAYNAGPGAVDKALTTGDNWQSALPAETQKYVTNGLAKLGQPAQPMQTAQAQTVTQITPLSNQTLEIEMPDGTIMHDVPPGTPPDEVERAWKSLTGKEDGNATGISKPSGTPSYGQQLNQIQKSGIQSAKDLVQGNYEDIGRTHPTPKTSALADLLFPAGSNGSFGSALANLGNIKPSNVTGSILEKMSDTPEGKALGAVGNGLFPYVGKAVNDANDFVSINTGIAPDNLQFAETLGGLKAPGAAGAAADAMTIGSKALGSAKNAVADSSLAKYGTPKIAELVNNESSGRTIATKPPLMTSADLKSNAAAAYKYATENGGFVAPELTNAFLSKAQKFAPPKTELSQKVTGNSAVDSYLKDLQNIEDQPLDLNTANALDQHLGDLIDQHTNLGKLDQQGRSFLNIQNSLRDTIESAPGNDALVQAKQYWKAAMQQGDFDRIMSKAELSDNPAQTIKSGFTQLANNPSRLRGYSPEQVTAIRQAAKTGIAGKALSITSSRLLPIAEAVGGGGIMGGAAGFAVNQASRAAAGKLQAARANKVAASITKNIKPFAPK